MSSEKKAPVLSEQQFRQIVAAARTHDQVETSGESPSWIYKHSARLADNGQSIIIGAGERWLGNDLPSIENTDSWALNTLTGE